MIHIYRPLATLTLGICLIANLIAIAGLGWLGIDLALMPVSDLRNLGLVIIAGLWAYVCWTCVEFVREIPQDMQDIWR